MSAERHTDDEIWTLDGREVRVSNLSKVFWPDDDLTKRDMLEYYRRIAPFILPYLRDHPLTLYVSPNGVTKRGFYRRDRPDSAPGWLGGVSYRPESREGELDAPLIEDAAGLVWYANRGAIEFHMWLSRRQDLTRPDWAVFDLDPGREVPFRRVLEAACRVRDALEAAGVSGFPKTSGGRGIHIFVPLDASHEFDVVREWVRDVTERLAAEHPDLIAVASGATHTGDQVTIDHAQNSIARNTAAPYTLRARPAAPVSTPLAWSEVESGAIEPGQFTIRTISQRLESVGDVWAPALSEPQRLPV